MGFSLFPPIQSQPGHQETCLVIPRDDGIISWDIQLEKGFFGMRALPGSLGSHVDEPEIIHGHGIPIFVEPIRGKVDGSGVNILLWKSSGKHKRLEKQLGKTGSPKRQREEQGGSLRMEFQGFGVEGS